VSHRVMGDESEVKVMEIGVAVDYQAGNGDAHEG
jgi:hypothetical protein